MIMVSLVLNLTKVNITLKNDYIYHFLCVHYSVGTSLEPIRNFIKLGLSAIHYLTLFRSSYYPPPSSTKGFLIAKHAGTLGTSSPQQLKFVNAFSYSLPPHSLPHASAQTSIPHQLTLLLNQIDIFSLVPPI